MANKTNTSVAIERDLENYPECPESHEPNRTTRRALEDARNRKGLTKAATVEELFKKLDQ